jgi:transcriptional regulator with XRE-family HTH domain
MYALARTCVSDYKPTTMGEVITASQFQAARARARLSNKQLAALLQVSPSTISNWLRDGVVGHAQAAVEDKLGMYLRDDSPNRPLSAYSDVELLAELWQRMDTYKQRSGEQTTPAEVSGNDPTQATHSGPILTERSGEGVRRGIAPRRPKPPVDGE